MSDDKFLSQTEIEELLKKIEEAKQELKEHGAKEADGTRWVKLCDFMRPDILGKRSIRNFTIIMEEFARSITDFFQREYGFKANVHVASVDQLMREEFIRCIPTPTFACAAPWLGGYVMLNMNPATFLCGFLKRQPIPDRYKNLSLEEQIARAKELAKKNKKHRKEPLYGVFEEKIFNQFFVEPMFIALLSSFQKMSDKPLEDFGEKKLVSTTTFLPYTESITEMGVLATLEISFEGRKDKFYPIDIFFNSTVIEELCEKRIIYESEKLKVIPLELPLGNVVAELGRCHLADGFVFEKNQVLELNTDAGNPLAVLIDGKKRFYGEALYLDDSRAVRLLGNDGLEEKELSLDEEDNFYNVRAVWGSVNAGSEKISGYGEGTIIELSEKWDEQVYIYLCEKLCAIGQVYIVDEHFAVKITDVM